jgi:hypothetical protein
MALLDEYSGSLRRVEELRKMKVDMGLGS